MGLKQVNPRSWWCSNHQVILFISVLCYLHEISISSSISSHVENSPCVRLFHQKGEFGCRVSSRDGVQLPLYGVIENNETLEKFVTDSSSQIIKQKVAAVISGSYFNESIVKEMVSTEKIGAILVLDDGSAASNLDTKGMEFSTDAQAPLGTDTPFSSFTVSPDYAWNSRGNSLAWEDYDLPIVMVKEESIQEVSNAGSENARKGLDAFPIYHANLDFYFGPSDVTSADCLQWENIAGERDPQCLPVGGQSVWATQGVRDQRPLVMAVGGIDSAAMFHEMAFGANDAVATIVTLLAAAEMLGRAEDSMSGLPSQVAFGLFQGEEWGYIGSRRFVKDISSFTCNNRVDGSETPIRMDMCLDPLYPSLAFTGVSLSDIQHLVAVDQVGLSGNSNLYVMGGGDSSSDLVDSLVSAGSNIDDDLTVGEASVTSSGDYSLPPTPASSFLQENSEMSVAVIAGYDSVFLDAAYHTPYDEPSRISADSVSMAAQLLAEGLFVASGGDSSTGLGVEVDDGLVSELLTCLTENSTCALVSNYIAQETTNLEAEAGIGIDYGFALHPVYYSGVYGSGIHGQPTFVRSYSDGSSSYGRFTEQWDKESDTVYTVPSSLESFIRGFLADQMAKGSSRTDSPCTTSMDCGFCGDAYTNATMECVQGTCACRTTFLHSALDPGLEATESLSVFDVVDDSSPIVTEPNWNAIGVQIYPFAGDYICYLALALGAFMTTVGGIGSAYLKKSLQKQKLL